MWGGTLKSGERAVDGRQRWRSGRISRNLCFKRGTKGWQDGERKKSVEEVEEGEDVGTTKVFFSSAITLRGSY